MMKSNRHGIDVLLLLAGAALTAVTLIVPAIGFLEWVTMIPLILGAYRICSDRNVGGVRTYFLGFLTVYFYYFILYHWLVNLYPLDFVGLDEGSSVAVILAGWLGLPLLQAIPGGLIFVFFRLFRRSRLAERAGILSVPTFAALWAVFEWSSTFGWTGVPWGRLPLGQLSSTEMLQSASLLGSYLVTFLIVAVNGFFAWAILHPSRMGCGILLAGCLLLGNFAFGFVRMNTSDAPTGDAVTVAVIQGNINSHEKWESGSSIRIWNTYAEYSREAAKDGAEIIVWTETALPYVLNNHSSFKQSLCDLAVECHADIVVGSFYDDEEGREYNALYYVTKEGNFLPERYYKRHLVPFGEYVPMKEVIMTLIPPLANVSALDDELTPGTDSGLFPTEYGKIGSLICFDSIYEALTLESVSDGAELILISSNDSWFYDSAAVYQHEGQARLRAIESGKYVVRAANTGISTVITPTGENTVRIEPLVAGYATKNVYFTDNLTLYDRVGNLFVYLCMAFFVGELLISPIIKKKQ